MPKYIDQLGSFENFEFSSVLTAEEIDKDKLKKYVFGVLTDKAKAQDARDAAKVETADVQTELDSTKAELSSKGNPDLAAKLTKAESERDEWKTKFEGLELTKLAEKVADEAGLTRVQAEYLKGTTEDELKASAEKFIKDNGIQIKDPDDEGDDDDADVSLRRTPRSTVQNPNDPAPNSGSDKPLDYDAIVAGFEANPFR